MDEKFSEYLDRVGWPSENQSPVAYIRDLTAKFVEWADTVYGKRKDEG